MTHRRKGGKGRDSPSTIHKKDCTVLKKDFDKFVDEVYVTQKSRKSLVLVLVHVPTSLCLL